MMGDNRHNSLDSRFWGFVPENHVVGKPVFNWLSIDPNKSGLDKIRWDRLFTVIHGEGKSRSYLIHFLIFIALWNLIPKLINKRKNS
jgi:signal peptidase I